jgi:hypothetical protein
MNLFFRNNRGNLEAISPESLRRSLAQLVSPDTSEEIQEFDAEEASSGQEALLSIFSKLDVDSNIISASKVEDALTQSGVSQGKIEMIFAMSRPHFLAMVYILFTSGPDEVSRLVDLSFSTRTRILMEILSPLTQSAGQNIISTAFDSTVAGFFKRESERSSKALDLGYFRPNETSSTVVNLSVSMVPDVFYTVYNLYNDKLYNKSYPEDWPLRRIFDAWKCPFAPNQFDLCKYEAIHEQSFEGASYGVWNRSTNVNKAPNFYENLMRASEYRTNGKETLSTEGLNRFLLNTYLPIASVKTFDDRLSNLSREWRGFDSSSNSSEAVRRGIWFSTSGVISSATYMPSYFSFAQWMHDDEEDISTANRDLAYWSSFMSNTSPGSTLRATESSISTTSADFSYLSDPALITFMKELFPVDSLDSERNSQDYTAKQLINRVGFNSIYPGATVKTFGVDPCRMAYSPKARKRAVQVSKFDVVAEDDGRLISMGPLSVIEFASSALARALDKVGYSDSDVVSLQSYEGAETYLELLRDNVVEAILAQSGSASDTANYNPLIRDDNANALNRVFVADLVSEFFDYLLASEDSQFAPYLSSESMGAYRLLNFVKHTLINLSDYMKAVQANQYYRQYVFMIALARGGLNREYAYAAVQGTIRPRTTETIPGDISTTEINGLLPAIGAVQVQ